MKRPIVTWGIGVLTGVAISTLAVSSFAHTAAQKLPDFVAADPKRAR